MRVWVDLGWGGGEGGGTTDGERCSLRTIAGGGLYGMYNICKCRCTCIIHRVLPGGCGLGGACGHTN